MCDFDSRKTKNRVSIFDLLLWSEAHSRCGGTKPSPAGEGKAPAEFEQLPVK
jgi:hypothetical protein